MKFYIDRDLGKSFGLALRLLGVEVQLHGERYSDAVPPHDDVWIPEVTGAGYIILTHDGKIRSRSAERQAFEVANARCFVLATRSAARLQNFRALMLAWDRVIEIIDSESAPYMFGVCQDRQADPVRGVATRRQVGRLVRSADRGAPPWE